MQTEADLATTDPRVDSTQELSNTEEPDDSNDSSSNHLQGSDISQADTAAIASPSASGSSPLSISNGETAAQVQQTLSRASEKSKSRVSGQTETTKKRNGGCEPPSKKPRKKYVITKNRENWTDEEHKLFLDALKKYGRSWKQIESHVRTKDVIQIRSHAQKYFLKVQKNNTGEHIPPPRPKRKQTATNGAGGATSMQTPAMRQQQPVPVALSPSLPHPQHQMAFAMATHPMAAHMQLPPHLYPLHALGLHAQTAQYMGFRHPMQALRPIPQQPRAQNGRPSAKTISPRLVDPKEFSAAMLHHQHQQQQQRRQQKQQREQQQRQHEKQKQQQGQHQEQQQQQQSQPRSQKQQELQPTQHGAAHQQDRSQPDQLRRSGSLQEGKKEMQIERDSMMNSSSTISAFQSMNPTHGEQQKFSQFVAAQESPPTIALHAAERKILAPVQRKKRGSRSQLSPAISKGKESESTPRNGESYSAEDISARARQIASRPPSNQEMRNPSSVANDSTGGDSMLDADDNATSPNFTRIYSFFAALFDPTHPLNIQNLMQRSDLSALDWEIIKLLVRNLEVNVESAVFRQQLKDTYQEQQIRLEGNESQDQ